MIRKEHLRKTNEVRMKTVKLPDNNIEPLTSEYSEVVQSIGCF